MNYYVIYKDPSDYPGKWVCRLHVDDPRRPGMVGIRVFPEAVEDTLEAVRQAVPVGYVNVGQYPQDDAAIYEVWI